MWSKSIEFLNPYEAIKVVIEKSCMTRKFKSGKKLRVMVGKLNEMLFL